MDVIEKFVVFNHKTKPFSIYSLGIDLSFMKVTDGGTGLIKLCWKKINKFVKDKHFTKSFIHALGVKPRVFSFHRKKKLAS